MKWLKRASAALLLLVAGVGIFIVTTAVKGSRPVGFQLVQVPDGIGGSFSTAIWYPTSASPRPTTLIGLQLLNVAPAGQILGTKLPLIVISHGNGGGPGSHADLAMALAAAGYIVAAPMHEGDNYLDESALTTATWPIDRTRQLRLATDYLLDKWKDHGQIDPNRVGAYGFSAGGYTVLVAAGAHPALKTIAAHCKHEREFVCGVLRQAKSPLLQAGISTIVSEPDPRIRAVVLAAPGLGFTMSGQALKAVTIPVQLWSAENDVNVPYASNTQIVREGLGHNADFHAVSGAAHMSFLAPCSFIGPPMLCKDPAGFDRKAFHKRMNASVIDFFNKNLR